MRDAVAGQLIEQQEASCREICD